MSPDKKERRSQSGVPAGWRRQAGTRPGASRVVKKALKRGPSFEKPRLVLGPLNYGLMGAGALSVVVGFLLLAARDISLAPFLLVLGYCVLIPAGLLVERVPGRSTQGASPAPSEGE